MWCPSLGLGEGSSVQFSHSVVSHSLRPHGPQHTRPPCLSPIPESTQTHVHQVVMPSNYLILCQPLLLLTSIFLSIREPEASATCSPNFLAFYHCMLTFLEKPLHASFIWINPRRSSMLNLGVPYSRKPSLMPRLLGCLFLLLLLFFSLFFSFLFLFYVLFFFNFFSCCIYFYFFYF